MSKPTKRRIRMEKYRRVPDIIKFGIILQCHNDAQYFKKMDSLLEDVEEWRS